jgi:hypothetical protein
MRVCKFVGLSLILTVLTLTAGSKEPLAQSCTVTLSPGSSLLEAIESAPSGAVICLGAGLWREGIIPLKKPLTLRGSGREQTRLQASLRTNIKRDEELSLAVEALTLERPQGDGLLLVGRARATLTGVTIFMASDDGLDLNHEAQATLRDVHILNSRDAGLELWDKSRLEVQQGAITGNFDGVELFDEAQARVSGTQILANHGRGALVDDKGQLHVVGAVVAENAWVGLTGREEARLTLEGAQVQRNRLDGLFVLDKATALLVRTAILGNGAAELCRQKETLCNGITLQGEAQVEARDSQIRENADWGIAGMLKKCGYEEDDFKGRVSLSGTAISNNNRTGTQSGETCY